MCKPALASPLRFLFYPLENFDAVRRGVASYTPSQFAHDALMQLLGLPRASKPIFVVAFHTGLRRGDMLGLEWSAVDLEAGHIRLMTEKTAGVHPLLKTAIAALEECRDRAVASELWLFVQHDGSRFSLTTLRRHFVFATKLTGSRRSFPPEL
jgi:integrase